MSHPSRSADHFDSESAALFWKKVQKSDGCWIWTGAKTNKGYGVIRRADKNYLAHRFSYTLKNGPISDGVFICHKCDNPLCVNPDHHFEGDNSANMRDCFSKGRGKIPLMKGENHPNSKITENIAKHIRILKESGLTEQKIADYLGATKRIVNMVSSGKTWKQND